MRRINAGLEFFADPLSLVFTLPATGDDSHPILHTHVGKFSSIEDDTQQHVNDHSQPVYQQLKVCVNSSERNFLLLQFGHRIPEKYFKRMLDQSDLSDFKD